MTKLLCEVYKSLKEDQMYLFVDKAEGLSRIPDALLNSFGKTALVTTLALTPEKKLARATAEAVLKAIEEQGFYLQMPPRKEQFESSMMEMSAKNEKLSR